MSRFRLYLLLLCVSPLAYGQVVSEQAMKASYFYNFMLYTQWPEQTAEQAMNLCVYGNNDLGSALIPLEDKKINGAKINVMYVAQTNNLKTCHLLFIPEREAGSLPAINRAIGNAPVMTVTDSDEGADTVIRLALEGKRIVFDVNLQRAKAAGLNISSRVLQLARKVK